jgi:hypothetical protein
MRYFLDTEYNGWGGDLLSLALVPDEGEELYLTLASAQPMLPWVERHVVPYIDMVPAQLACPRLGRLDAAFALEQYLKHDPAPLVVADWPEDIALLAALTIVGEGRMIDVPKLAFQLIRLDNFSTAENSAVPHNALHDARALRDHVVQLEP